VTINSIIEDRQSCINSITELLLEVQTGNVSCRAATRLIVDGFMAAVDKAIDEAVAETTEEE